MSGATKCSAFSSVWCRWPSQDHMDQDCRPFSGTGQASCQIAENEGVEAVRNAGERRSPLLQAGEGSGQGGLRYGSARGVREVKGLEATKHGRIVVVRCCQLPGDPPERDLRRAPRSGPPPNSSCPLNRWKDLEPWPV